MGTIFIQSDSVLVRHFLTTFYCARLVSSILLAFSLVSFILHSDTVAQEAITAGASDKLVLVHYMPWYEAKPESPQWGWHWTMNHFDPEQEANNKRPIASHFYPLIGPYDSADVAVIDYHLETMKRAGIDGVIVDWYGLTDFRDYPTLHRATTRILEQCEKRNLKFVICYEDQTIPALVEAGRLQASNRVSHAAAEIDWLGKYWFKSASYVRLDGKPLLLSFGQTGLTDSEWTSVFFQTSTQVAYFSQHHRRHAAVGAFDWPVPSEGVKAVEQFQMRAKGWKHAIPVAFPRFVDIYEQAKIGPSYGRIDDDSGKVFETTLEACLKSSAAIVQIATWNDWGEGTQIEPSTEFGFRDLETVQRLRKKWLDPNFSYNAADLKAAFQRFQQAKR